MKISLIGYGKMGQAIEEVARSRGHEISDKFTSSNKHELTAKNLQKADVVIEFTEPSSAYANIVKCFDAGIPVITGTTGWNDHIHEIEKLCQQKNGSILYASNFSIGVNILFELNRQLAKLMNNQSDYNVSIEETHHIHKLDVPSGTAITLADDISHKIDRKKGWELEDNNSTKTDKEKTKITSFRRDEVIGTHSVTYENDIDILQISHFAKSRLGFATGAVIAAEWIQNKKGVSTMKDLLDSLK
jgi:4-hydroxy-tetrahydrodipicolinate reductase